MIKIILPILSAFLFSCTTSKNLKDINSTIKIESACLENGICNFEIYPNKSTTIKEDAFGKIYYELEENPNAEVYLYTFSEKETDTTLADASYREEIVFELEKNSHVLFRDEELQNTKMLFGVFCFCKGKAGYYEVKKGNLEKTKDRINLSISEIVNNQRTKQINSVIKKGAK